MRFEVGDRVHAVDRGGVALAVAGTIRRLPTDFNDRAHIDWDYGEAGYYPLDRLRIEDPRRLDPERLAEWLLTNQDEL